MSRGAALGASPWARVIELCATIAAPAAAGLALVSLLTTGADATRNDLHLVLPESAFAGSAVPVRAWLYVGLERPEGPTLVAARTVLELTNARGERHAGQARLRAGYRNTLEGELAVPAGVQGPLRVRAHAMLGETEVELERPLAIERVPASEQRPKERAIEQPRASRALSTLALGPLQLLAKNAPSGALPVLDVQVQGGACVPQATCVLWVDAGDASLSVQAVGNASAQPVRAEPIEGPVARLELRTDGPEASVELRALRDGEPVARRNVRLPLTLGADALLLERTRLAPLEPAQIRLQLPNAERDGCIVDAFAQGRWIHSASLPDCTHAATLPFALDAPFGGQAVVRLQARRDPFGSDQAAVRALIVAPEPEIDARALGSLAHLALARAPDDKLAARVAAAPEVHVAASDRVTGYLLALFEQGVVKLPPPSTSQPLALERLSAQRVRARRLALLMLALAGVSLVIVVVQRGLRAASLASSVLRESGQAEELLARGRSRMRARVLLSAASLVLAFVAIALYILARSTAF